jgi:hypothetical protein
MKERKSKMLGTCPVYRAAKVVQEVGVDGRLGVGETRAGGEASRSGANGEAQAIAPTFAWEIERSSAEVWLRLPSKWILNDFDSVVRPKVLENLLELTVDADTFRASASTRDACLDSGISP